MTKHFLFQPGCWLGQGTIVFSSSPEELKFYMRWNVQAEADGMIHCVQEIELHGIADKMINHYSFDIKGVDKFLLELQNDILGKIPGNGLCNDRVLAWEFRQSPTQFEGVEIYELRPDGSYSTRAEYITGDQYRTTIRGTLWTQAGSAKEETQET